MDMKSDGKKDVIAKAVQYPLDLSTTESWSQGLGVTESFRLFAGGE